MNEIRPHQVQLAQADLRRQHAHFVESGNLWRRRRRSDQRQREYKKPQQISELHTNTRFLMHKASVGATDAGGDGFKLPPILQIVHEKI